MNRKRVINRRTHKDKMVGKVLNFEPKDLISLGIVKDLTKYNELTDEVLNELYSKCRTYMESVGYEFGEFKGYRVILSKSNKIAEFRVEFRHIK